MIRRLVLALVVLVGAGGPAVAEPPRRPNIVLIVADDLGYGHVGCFGQEKIATPNIDRLAAEGMRFTHFYSGANVCAPSRSALMTGLHTGHTPVRNNGLKRHLDAGDVTVAEVLKRAGYATGGFGKWGLGGEDTPGVAVKQGFDTWFGQYSQVHAHFYYPHFLMHDLERHPLPENEGKKRGKYAQDAIHEQALEFITANRDRPFFAYLPYILPHVELVAPPEARKPYEGRWPKIGRADPRPGYLGSDDAYAEFAGMVSHLDRQVGEVMALLKRLGIDDDTVVIFTSDNGPQPGAWTDIFVDFFDGNGPFRGAKGQLLRGRHPRADDRPLARPDRAGDGERARRLLPGRHADPGGPGRGAGPPAGGPRRPLVRADLARPARGAGDAPLPLLGGGGAEAGHGPAGRAMGKLEGGASWARGGLGTV